MRFIWRSKVKIPRYRIGYEQINHDRGDYLRTLAALQYLFIRLFTGKVSGASSVQVLEE